MEGLALLPDSNRPEPRVPVAAADSVDLCASPVVGGGDVDEDVSSIDVLHHLIQVFPRQFLYESVSRVGKFRAHQNGVQGFSLSASVRRFFSARAASTSGV